MNTPGTLFEVASILLAAAALACGMVWVLVARVDGADTASVDPQASGAWRTGTRLCLALSCLFVPAALGKSWVEPQSPENASYTPIPANWGALWIYALSLPVEWSRSGLEGAGRRTLTGGLLAGVGILLLGMCLTAWTTLNPAPVPECADESPMIDAGALAVRSVAALGLALIPLAGIALRLASPIVPPLSAAAAGVAMAMWLQPTLPPLGWLPTSMGAGAALAGVFVAALMLLGWMAARGPISTMVGVGLYFGLSVGGSHFLGTLQT